MCHTACRDTALHFNRMNENNKMNLRIEGLYELAKAAKASLTASPADLPRLFHFCFEFRFLF
jgi:hypothetical protein